jgi:hypothetical protein
VSGSFSGDFFDRARRWAFAVMLLAGLAAIVGSSLEWVTISARPRLLEGTRFPGDASVERPRVSKPFTGLEATDGWWSLFGGVLLVLSAILLLVRRTSLWAWTGLAGAVLVGAIALADYRGIGNLSSSISHRMDIVGGAEPGIGITLVAAAALAGLVGSVVGIAASPRRFGTERP